MARRRTAPTDLAHNWATQARPRRRAWARGTVQKHVDGVAGTQPQEYEYRIPPAEPCIRQEHVHIQDDSIHETG